MAQYHQGDEGLRNLRRRAPMMAVWDDHEISNVSSSPFVCITAIGKLCEFQMLTRLPQRQNAYGYGTASSVSKLSKILRLNAQKFGHLTFRHTQTGAENHQPICPANSTSPDTDKAKNQCDRDEGDAVERFRNAAQSYMEWLRLRREYSIVEKHSYDSPLFGCSS
jgi:hypothetical protein